MHYDNVRSQIRTGDLIVFSRSDFFSTIVRVVTRSEFSHLGVAYVKEGRVMVMESVLSGVRIQPLSMDEEFFWIKRPKAKLNKVAVNWAFSKLGSPYSIWQAILAGIHRLKAGEDDKWQCVEFAMSIYAVDGEEIDIKETPSRMVKYAMENWSPAVFVSK